MGQNWSKYHPTGLNGIPRYSNLDHSPFQSETEARREKRCEKLVLGTELVSGFFPAFCSMVESEKAASLDGTPRIMRFGI